MSYRSHNTLHNQKRKQHLKTEIIYAISAAHNLLTHHLAFHFSPHLSIAKIGHSRIGTPIN